MNKDFEQYLMRVLGKQAEHLTMATKHITRLKAELWEIENVVLDLEAKLERLISETREHLKGGSK